VRVPRAKLERNGTADAANGVPRRVLRIVGDETEGHDALHHDVQLFYGLEVDRRALTLLTKVCPARTAVATADGSFLFLCFLADTVGVAEARAASAMTSAPRTCPSSCPVNIIKSEQGVLLCSRKVHAFQRAR
jgi:hypothetical protein